MMIAHALPLEKEHMVRFVNVQAVEPSEVLAREVGAGERRASSNAHTGNAVDVVRLLKT